MDARRRLLLVALALCALPALARPAAAFVRSVSAAGSQLYWSSSCEVVTIYLNGFTEMTADEVAKSIGAAAAAWGPDQVTCPAATGDAGNGHPFFQIIPQLSTGGAAPGVAHDGKNSIIFVTNDWGASGESAEALAFTSVWKEPGGQIVDADIEINAEPLAMPNLLANLDPGAAPPRNGQFRVDLQTLMTHEFGHFLGLAHTCVLDQLTGSGGGDTGDSDEPPGVPTCTDATAEEVESVMYPIIDSESIAKRVLTTDDARGVCAIYDPTTPGTHLCTGNTPDDGCGCAAAGAGLESGAPAILAALALVLVRRRRRRQA